MISPIDRSTERKRIHKRIREKVSGKPNRPRLCVYRSSKYLYVQIIDDTQGKTLAAASTAEKDVRGDLKQAGNIQASKLLGKVIADLSHHGFVIAFQIHHRQLFRSPTHQAFDQLPAARPAVDVVTQCDNRCTRSRRMLDDFVDGRL